ncbi:transposase [Acidovorax sp. CCYZU-2555]|uniref:RNA-guided endonuclease InsQ/TnpB family protein n=1 Tax=Acidovorax sp. CCYZU-2555 TaxID=2835042 RepID=UPI0032E04170
MGIDLGLKEAAVASDGQRIEGRFYRRLEAKLRIAQRAQKRPRVKAIHAKIANRRKDMLHQFSTQLVRNNAAIFVGDVASAKLVKIKMAKSTLDAGWAMLKAMLEYKSHQAGIVFEVVNESYTTQTCSCCGTIPASSPKGRAGLRMREWVCSDCGTRCNKHSRGGTSPSCRRNRRSFWPVRMSNERNMSFPSSNGRRRVHSSLTLKLLPSS